MTKIEFNYNFNCLSKEGRDSIPVKVKNFKFSVNVPKKLNNKTLDELYKLYYDDALNYAAYKIRVKMYDLVYTNCN